MVDGSETATQFDHRARNRRQNDPPGRARKSNPPGLHSVCGTRCDPLHGITVLCRHSDPARTAAAMSRPAAIKAVTSPLARLRCCDQNCAVESSGTGGLTDKVRQGRHAAEASRPANCAADQAPADPTETVAVPDLDQVQPAASVQDPRRASDSTLWDEVITCYHSRIQSPDWRTAALRRSPPDGAPPAMVLTATKRMVGLDHASQIAFASDASFLCRLTHALTQIGGTRRTAWPKLRCRAMPSGGRPPHRLLQYSPHV